MCVVKGFVHGRTLRKLPERGEAKPFSMLLRQVRQVLRYSEHDILDVVSLQMKAPRNNQRAAHAAMHLRSDPSQQKSARLDPAHEGIQALNLAQSSWVYEVLQGPLRPLH